MYLDNPVGKPEVGLWSDIVLVLAVPEVLRVVWNSGICFPTNVAVLPVAGFESALLPVLGGQIILHRGA